MAPRTVSETFYLRCLAFVVTILLAASEVEAQEGNGGLTRKTTAVVGGAIYKDNSVCYDSQKQKVKCTRKKAIIVGTIISSLFVLLGALYLYATCSERRKKRKALSATAENEPLSNGTRNTPDFEKGITEKNTNESDDDFDLHPNKSDGASVSTVSDFSSHVRPLGLTPTYTPVETSVTRP